MKSLKMLVGLVAVAFIMSWTAVSQAEEIVIGYTGPLSGPAAEYGQDILSGVDMAIKELNAAGGVRLVERSTLSGWKNLMTGLTPRRQ